jgi:3',5'-cyclic AMP phosphodiesterase CpdA
MATLAHLSDPHLGPLPAPHAFELASKRLLGFINWTRKRRLVHRGEVLAALVADLKAQSADHVAVTGDLANISLPQEFAAARAWLETLGAARDVTVVPGNHDVYVRAARLEPARNWGEFMCSDTAAASDIVFPFVRRRGPLALVGLTTAVPTAPFMATGRLGAAQVERLGDTLAALGREPCFRIVLIHHPPVSTPARRLKRLTDSAALRATLARHGADLVLHGHDHVHSRVWLDGPAGRIPTVGVPSASATADNKDDPAAYNIYRIEGAPGAWRCEAVTRGLAPAGGEVVELKRQTLAG